MLLQCDVYKYLASQVRGPPLGLTFNQFGFYPHIGLSSRHSVAGWYLPDLCLLRHAALSFRFPIRISRTMTGCWNTCLKLAKVQLSKGLYGRTKHLAETLDVSAVMDFARFVTCHVHNSKLTGFGRICKTFYSVPIRYILFLRSSKIE
jgi:hypothetical protein